MPITEYSIEKILSAWERVKDTGFEWYGVLLGRPSNYLVMVDIDDAEATRAVEEGRSRRGSGYLMTWPQR